MPWLMFCQQPPLSAITLHVQPPHTRVLNRPATPTSVCYDKLGKFILLCAIRLLAQFPLETCTELPSPDLHYLHSLQFQF